MHIGQPLATCRPSCRLQAEQRDVHQAERLLRGPRLRRRHLHFQCAPQPFCTACLWRAWARQRRRHLSKPHFPAFRFRLKLDNPSILSGFCSGPVRRDGASANLRPLPRPARQLHQGHGPRRLSPLGAAQGGHGRDEEAGPDVSDRLGQSARRGLGAARHAPRRCVHAHTLVAMTSSACVVCGAGGCKHTLL